MSDIVFLRAWTQILASYSLVYILRIRLGYIYFTEIENLFVKSTLDKGIN